MKKNKEIIQSGNILMNDEESESDNVARTCNSEADKHENTSSTYGDEGKKKNLSMSEKEETRNC